MNDYYPGTNWEHDDRGWDRAALAIVLESARELNSTDIAVVHRGRLVADARWQPGPVAAAEVVESLPDGRVRQDIASAQKSVSSVLAAIAVGRGLLDINSPVSAHLGKGWAGPKAPPSEGRITVRHLLSHQAGLFAFDEQGDRNLVADLDRLAVVLARQKPSWARRRRIASRASSAFSFL